MGTHHRRFVRNRYGIRTTLSGKVAVITGANSGIGLATAKRFVEEGAHVVITGRRKKELDEAAEQIGKNVTAVQGDVSRSEDLDRLYAEVKARHGHIDILFADAGVGQVAPLGAITEEHFDREFDINVKGLLFSVQKALPLLRDGGSIILNSSIAGRKGIEGFSVYNASKAAVRSFARSWTSDLKGRKIRVNAISSGPIETPIFGKMGLSQEQFREFATSIVSQLPLGDPRTGSTHHLFDPLDCIHAVTAHIPERGHHCVRYDGALANRAQSPIAFSEQQTPPAPDPAASGETTSEFV